MMGAYKLKSSIYRASKRFFVNKKKRSFIKNPFFMIFMVIVESKAHFTQSLTIDQRTLGVRAQMHGCETKTRA